MKKLMNVLGHANIVFAGVFVTLWVINLINPAMHFLSSGVTNVFLLLFCLSAATLGVLSVMQYRRHKRMLHDRAVAAARARRQGGAPVRPPRRNYQ